jgi:hypothetical protein
MAVITDNPGRLDPIVEQDSGIPTEAMFVWMSLLADLLQQGYTGTITTAALTGAGAQGSMTFQNGVLVAQTQAT